MIPASSETGDPSEPDRVDALARAAAAGDRVALEDLLGVVRPRILAVCCQVLPHGPDAEDACQEAMLSVADPAEGGRLDRPDPRGTSVIVGTRLDLLEAMETTGAGHPQYLEPLVLRDVDGLPYGEIAATLGLPLGTVTAQVHHGRPLARPLLRDVV